MENKIEITKGETVRLNSGGPLMTVSNILSNNQFECIWFNADDEVCIHTFDVELIFPDEDEDWVELDEEDFDDEELENWDEEEEDDEEEEKSEKH